MFTCQELSEGVVVKIAFSIWAFAEVSVRLPELAEKERTLADRSVTKPRISRAILE